MLRRMSVDRALARRWFVAPVTLAALTLGACGDEDDPSGPSDAEIALEWFESVNAGDDADVNILSSDAPGASGGPDIEADLLSSFITGGTTQLLVDSFDEIDGLILALQGVDGHIEIDYDTDRTAATISVTLQGDVPAESFSLRVAGTQGSDVGDYVTIPVNIVEVGTGPIQVSISWDAPSDVDLHVVEPGGEEIYWGDRVSASGGELDLDSNAGCFIDNVNNENITWTDEADPASGQYTVRVNYWDSCDVSSTNYVVTVRVEGRDTRTYAGTLTGTGNGGGQGAGSVVATFTY